MALTKIDRLVGIAPVPQQMTGATEDTDGNFGMVPPPMAGDQDKVLTGNGQWTKFQSGGVTMPSGKYCLSRWRHVTPNQRDIMDAAEVLGDTEWALDWRPYLIDMTPVTGETYKTPVKELKKDNWLRDIDGNYAPVAGITSAQASACNAQMYWKTGSQNPIASSFYDNGTFKAAAFWEYCKANLSTINSTYGTSYNFPIEVKLYNASGTAFSYGSHTSNHIPAPWETTDIKYSVFIGRPDDVYLVDGVIGESGKRWHGILADDEEFDGADFTAFKLARTGIAPGPATCKTVNSLPSLRHFFYNYPAGTTFSYNYNSSTGQVTGDLSAACNGERYRDGNSSYSYTTSFYDNGHYPLVQRGSNGGGNSASDSNPEQYAPNARNAAMYARYNNSSVMNTVPVAEYGFPSMNTFFNCLDTAYGTKFWFKNTRFSPGIASSFPCKNEAEWQLNGGVRCTYSGSTTYYTWGESAPFGGANWSNTVNWFKGKFQCNEPQIAASIATEMGVAAGQTFSWNGGKWHFDEIEQDGMNIKPVALGEGSMNCRIYKVMDFTYSSYNVSMNLVCGLAEGVNFGGDMWSYVQGGVELVVSIENDTDSTYKSSPDRTDVFVQFDQSKWHTEDMRNSNNYNTFWYKGSSAPFDFEDTYLKVGESTCYAGYVRSRLSYGPTATEFGAGMNEQGDDTHYGWSKGEGYYDNSKIDDVSTSGVGRGYRHRKAVRFRGNAVNVLASPRYLSALVRAGFVYVGSGCSAQVLLPPQA